MQLRNLGLIHQSLIALVAGALMVFAYAPFNLFVLAPVCWAVLWLLWQEGSPRRVACLSLAWAFGYFWSGGGWLFVAFHTYGGMAAWLSIFLLSIFFLYMSLYPVLSGWLFARLRGTQPIMNAALAAACWMLGEWLRALVFTGLPWLSVGYTQSPPSPLAGYAPIFGSYATGFLLIFSTALLVTAACNKIWRLRAGLLALGILCAGAALRLIAWTAPAGDPIRVALIQPNIPQDLKWDVARLNEWLAHNLSLAQKHPAQLVALPETTLPLFDYQLPEGYLDALAEGAKSQGGDVITGAFTRDDAGHIFNSAISHGTQAPQVYRKHHLLPFGEYVPPAMRWLTDLVNIPMADQTRGAEKQTPMHIGNQLVAVNICYEDVFGEELIYALPEATMMLNISNLAWYGDSHAQPQHLQIAQFRALESGRPMLRSTNTGMTAIIMPDGSVPHVLKAFTTDAIEADVRGYQGTTPYTRWGNWPLLALVFSTLLWGLHQKRHR